MVKTFFKAIQIYLTTILDDNYIFKQLQYSTSGEGHFDGSVVMGKPTE